MDNKELYKKINKIEGCVSVENCARVLTNLCLHDMITTETKVVDVLNLIESYKEGGRDWYTTEILVVNSEDNENGI